MNKCARFTWLRSIMCRTAAVFAVLAFVGATAYAAGNVYNWTDVPQNQQVPIVRATFDAGGYQIYDSVGETIIVPFQNHNLYVMRFGVSHTGQMYFINRGDSPVLFVPPGGYLENASEPGARWYPFSQRFHPAHPVFIGIAPSWHAYITMGWYPHMYYWGGYWGHASFGLGIFVAMVGLFVLIDGHHCDGWHPYFDYCVHHGGWHHPEYYRRDFYHWAEHPSPGRRPFHSFAHASHAGFGGGGHFHAGHPGGFAHAGFHGIRNMGGFGGHARGGGHANHGFGARNHAFGGGGQRSHGGGAFRSHSFGGGQSFGGRGHSFGGGRSHGGGDHSFGGGGRSFGGGGGFRSHGGGGHDGGGGGHSSGRDHRR